MPGLLTAQTLVKMAHQGTTSLLGFVYHSQLSVSMGLRLKSRGEYRLTELGRERYYRLAHSLCAQFSVRQFEATPMRIRIIKRTAMVIMFKAVKRLFMSWSGQIAPFRVLTAFCTGSNTSELAR